MKKFNPREIYEYVEKHISIFHQRRLDYVQNEVDLLKISKLTGIDLEFEKDEALYVVEIKAGWNWGNSSQIRQLKINFKSAKKLLLEKTGKKIVAVNGCCFGRDNKPDKGDYLKLCGQRFWELISGNE